MKLAQTEVYEVATFYHHFDVVKEGERRAAGAHRARLRRPVVRDGRRAGPAGAPAGAAGPRRARDRGAVHRPLRAGAGGRGRPEPGAARRPCDTVAARGRGRGRRATRRKASSTSPRTRPTAATRCCAECLGGERDVESVIKTLESVGPARPRRRRLSRPAASGASCAREPAPRLMAVNIDEGEPGTFKDRVYLERDPHRFLEGMLIAAWAVGIDDDLHLPARRVPRLPRAARSRARRSCAPPRRIAGMPADRPAPRRRRLHLRRRVGDDRVDRRQARHAAAAPAVRRAGRPVRPADARAQLRDAVLGARHPREGRRLVRRARPQRPQGPALVLGLGPRAASPACKLAPAGITCRS